MFSGVQFCGVNTSYSVLPYVNTERPVFYRERYAGMYASWVYPLAQVRLPNSLSKTKTFTFLLQLESTSLYHDDRPSGTLSQLLNT